MRNLKKERDNTIHTLSTLMLDVHWNWRMDAFDEIVIYHISEYWTKGRALFIPTVHNSIKIRLDMKDRLYLQRKSVEEFNEFFLKIK